MAAGARARGPPRGQAGAGPWSETVEPETDAPGQFAHRAEIEEPVADAARGASGHVRGEPCGRDAVAGEKHRHGPVGPAAAQRRCNVGNSHSPAFQLTG